MKPTPPSSRQALTGRLLAVPLLLTASAACSQPSAPEVNSPPGVSSKGLTVDKGSQQGGVANLPFAQGRSFASLDEYLEFRERRGAYDVPWYRQVRPGVYQLVSRRAPGAEPQTYSREELARKFGFED